MLEQTPHRVVARDKPIRGHATKSVRDFYFIDHSLNVKANNSTIEKSARNVIEIESDIMNALI